MPDQIIAERGLPRAMRCDSGPELISRHFLAWALDRKIDLVHIQPGKPTQNACMESFNSKLCEECLRVSWFQNLIEARRIIAAWRHVGFACLKNDSAVFQFPTATAAAC